jgi:drug/metabolite transporter (DMT)-like permease
LNQNGKEWRDIGLFFILSIAWALNYPFLKIALKFEPPMVTLFFRILFALIFSIPFAYSSLHLIKKIVFARLFLTSLLTITLSLGLWFLAEQSETSSLSSIIIYTYPVISVFLSWLILSEKMSISKITGVIVGFGGIVIIFYTQLSVEYNIAIFLLICSAISTSLGTIYYKKYLTGEDIGAVTFYQFLLALPILFIMSIFYGGFRPLTMNFILITLYMGSIGSSASYFIYWSLIRKYNVSHVSPYLFAVPAFSILLSIITIHEGITPVILAGFVLISIGIYLSSR